MQPASLPASSAASAPPASVLASTPGMVASIDASRPASMVASGRLSEASGAPPSCVRSASSPQLMHNAKKRSARNASGRDMGHRLSKSKPNSSDLYSNDQPAESVQGFHELVLDLADWVNEI